MVTVDSVDDEGVEIADDETDDKEDSLPRLEKDSTGE